MKFATSTAALFALLTAVNAHDILHRQAHRRQATSAASSAAVSSPALAASGSGASGSQAAATSILAPTTTSKVSTPLITATPSILPVSEYSLGMSIEGTLAATTTFSPGVSVPVSGAPALPTALVFKQGDWPRQDVVVEDLTSDDVTEWMKELDGWDIPDIAPTVDGSCAGDPTAYAEAAERGWWTCGSHTRDTDIVACPNKMDWGVSFDDGPSPYTQTLLNYLTEKDLKATFFVVGSRIIERPQVLIEEYMAGHEISVHTWSHRPLTSLTNQQIVAELGWTRKAIKTVLGVTPTTMRPPYGDIDDRVRAISLAMGMAPIIWTRTDASGPFDTNDWRVAGGQVTGDQQQAIFNSILGNASTIDTGFIVLQHDLFQITVDLARGFTLQAAQAHSPPFDLKPIGTCLGWPAEDLYLETTTNKTFPYTNSTAGSDKPDAAQSGGSGSSGSGSSSSGGVFAVARPAIVPAAASLAVVLVGAMFA